MRRFLSAIAFLATLVVVVGSAGCGQRFDTGSAQAPTASDLAADAVTALEAKGSAHFVADMKTGIETGGQTLPFKVHAEGDASRTGLDAEGSLSFGAVSVTGHVLLDEHNLFIQFMNEWYGEHQGLADAVGQAKKNHDGQVWDELATPDGIRRNFDRLFDGDVTAGPAVDGAATWKFDGHFDAGGIADFAKRFDAKLTDRDEAMFETLAGASDFVIVVGQEDHLPRRLEFHVHLSAAELKQMQDSGSSAFQGAENFDGTLQLSKFGEPVEIKPPASFKSLDALFEQFFSGIE